MERGSITIVAATCLNRVSLNLRALDVKKEETYSMELKQLGKVSQMDSQHETQSGR